MLSIKEKIPIRSYSGEKWITNKTNKKYLAKDFEHRCAYCDDLDKYNGGERSYHVEHFAPKEKFPELKFTYDNLLYACPYCNESKSDAWPSDEATINVVNNEGFLDPCKDEYYKNLYRNEDGSIGYSTELGKYIYTKLNLCLKRHQVNYNLNQINKRIDALQEMINAKKAVEQDVTALEALHYQLLKEFREDIQLL